MNHDLIKRSPEVRKAPPEGFRQAEGPFRVAIPFHSGDAPNCLRMLKWVASLGGYRRDTVLIYEKDVDSRLVAEIEEWSKRAFGPLQTHIQIGKLGVPWPGGPNYTFAELCKHMWNRKPERPWLLLEPDMLPLQRPWLKTLEEEYLEARRPFMGAWVEHYDLMNGGGVYPPDVLSWCPEFFATDPLLQPAYDCVIAPQIVPFMHRVNHLMPHIWTSRDNGRPGGLGSTIPKWTEEMVRWVCDKNAVLLHRAKDNEPLIHILKTL